MSPTAFLTALLLPPLLILPAFAWLRPALLEVLGELCGTPRRADFWLRAATLLALSACWVLTLAFGTAAGAELEILRRQLALIAGGVFISIAWIARSVFRSVREAQALAALSQPGAPS